MLTGGPAERLVRAARRGRGAPLGSRLVCEEVFGPVCVVNAFDSEEEAVRTANDTRTASTRWCSPRTSPARTGSRPH